MYQWYETEDPQNNMEAADHDSHRQPVISDSSNNVESVSTVCPGSSDPFYIVSYYIKWDTTSWTYCILAT